MASALTPTCQVVLNDTIRAFAGGKWDVNVDALHAHIVRRYPAIAARMAIADVAQALRKVGFVRDRDIAAWKHRDRDDPRWGRRS